MMRSRTARSSRSIRPMSETLERRRLLASASTLFSTDFATNPWQTTPGPQSSGVSASLAYGGYGTIDVAGGTTNSNALRLTVDTAPSTGWTSDLSSGPLAVSNPSITNLGLLTLSFNLSASQAKPVKVFVTSYDASGNRTGGLATTISPAAAYSYQRFAVDLSTMKASGAGTFNPTAPKVSFEFEMSSANGWSTATAAQLRLDNVAYSKPALYVNANLPTTGTHNGLTEATAFRAPQAALDASQPGDVILLMNGTYNNITANSGAMKFNKGGTPSQWVSVKNYPGQSPLIYNEAWNAILIGAQNTTVTTAAVAYVEVRGLHVQGDSAQVGTRNGTPDGAYDSTQPAGTYGKYGYLVGASNPQTNGNGISIDGRYETNKPHDIRFADNWVEDMAGAGIGAGDCDRVQIENNLVQDNCYWDIYATSGISVLSTYSFDGVGGATTRLVRNNITSGNIHKEIWASHGDYSDGNGIIIDINFTPDYDVAAGKPYQEATGRTLVTDNISYDNGGSGIHAYNSKHVDIVNNVAYLNSASSHLQYGQIFANYADDVRIYNNILVAPVANTAAGQKAEPVNGNNKSTNTIFNGNVYFGGNIAPVMGTNDVKADPKFVNASVDKAVANFRLQSTSPGINRGTTALAPYFDADGLVHYGNPDSGAYEYLPPAPTGIALAAASDTGTAGDNRTNLNNAAAAKRLAFVVAGTVSGATVTLYANGVAIGSAIATGTSTTVTTDGTTALADGIVAITAVQTFATAPSAATATPLNVTIDTVGPAMAAVPMVVDDGTAQRSRVRTVTLAFAESVTLDAAALTVLNTTTGTTAPFTLSSAAGGTLYTLAFAGTSLDDGVWQLALPATAGRDVAGNALLGGDVTFAFHRLFGDINGDRTITIADFNVLAAAFGTSAPNPAFVSALDSNGDDAITIADFNALASRFGTSLPIYAPLTIAARPATTKTAAAAVVAAARPTAVARRSA